jgi:hypothetical protein
MKGWFQTILAVTLIVGGFSGAASAAPIQIGLLSFDSDGAISTFNITNLTGANALPPDFPLETLVTINVTSLIASTTSGNLTLGPGAFSTDASGNVNCTAAGDASTGGCNFAAYTLTGATLAGTFSPVTGLLGLPPGYVGIESAFTATLAPDPNCGTELTAGCDITVISGTLVAQSQPAVPEPAAAMLLPLGLGALAAFRARRRARPPHHE